MPKPVEITELSQLEKLSHGEPIVVELQIRNQLVRLVGRRLKPAEAKEVKLLIERALPPILPPEKSSRAFAIPTTRLPTRASWFARARRFSPAMQLGTARARSIRRRNLGFIQRPAIW